MSHTPTPEDPSATCEAYAPWIDDYVDDALSADQRQELRGHLEGCVPCRRDLDTLRRLLAAAEALPDAVDLDEVPGASSSQELWAGIAPRLAARSEEPKGGGRRLAESEMDFELNRPWRTLGWGQALAAGLLLAVGFGLAHLLNLPLQTPQLARGPETDPEGWVAQVDSRIDDRGAGRGAGRGDFMTAEVEFLRAKEALMTSVFQRREELSPETLELLQTNLEVIDRAIRELRAALHQDPDNPRLEGRVLDNYRRELSLLKRFASQDV